MLQDALDERLEDLEYARRVSKESPDMRDAFLQQMGPGVPPENSGSEPSRPARRWLPWAAIGAAAAAASLAVFLRGAGSHDDVVDDGRGPLMRDPDENHSSTVSLVSAEGRRVVVNLGAGFLPAGYYHARAKTLDGETLAESRGDSSETWSFLVPEPHAVPAELTIEVDLYMEGASIPERSWSSRVILAR